MEITKIYVAHGDGGERGIGPVIGCALFKSDAELMAKGKGFHGDGEVLQGYGIVFGDNIYRLASPDVYVNGVLLADTKAEAKRIALGKLTSDEIRLLGICVDNL